MRIAFIADSLPSFKIHKDSTYAMMVEAARRGHERWPRPRKADSSNCAKQGLKSPPYRTFAHHCSRDLYKLPR
ncbi:MAG: hypothetical protein E6H70_06230 [Betaproteobacteria bacterium]|nr:MAG: hypothetical protein E6H70_06230 [Betaproteobacteria bacterium]